MEDYYFSIPNQRDMNALKMLIAGCENDVYYESADGDRLCLKSVFGQFIFFTLNQITDVMPCQSWLHCTGEADREKLSRLLIPHIRTD